MIIASWPSQIDAVAGRSMAAATLHACTQTLISPPQFSPNKNIVPLRREARTHRPGAGCCLFSETIGGGARVAAVAVGSGLHSCDFVWGKGTPKKKKKKKKVNPRTGSHDGNMAMPMRGPAARRKGKKSRTRRRHADADDDDPASQRAGPPCAGSSTKRSAAQRAPAPRANTKQVACK
jgi:hypothetical protein